MAKSQLSLAAAMVFLPNTFFHPDLMFITFSLGAFRYTSNNDNV